MVKSLLVCLTAAGLAIATSSTVLADPTGSNRTTVSGGNGQGGAGYDPSGTHANAGQPGQEPSSLPPPGSPGSSGYIYILIDSTNPKLPAHYRAHNPCPAGTTGYAVFDATGNGLGEVCVSNQPAPAPSPVELAQQASASQPWPSLVVAANPNTGVSGMESWFWVSGSPAMPDATASVSSLSVTVTAHLVDANWQFGDGSSLDSGSDLGQPYPIRSDVRHVYQSDSYGQQGGFVLALQVFYNVTYRVNGGPPQPLGLKSTTFSRPFVVNQVQPQGVTS
jgi:hypothetical protein